VWDATTGKELLTLRDHGDIVKSVHGAQRETIGDRERDHTVRVWDATTGVELLTLTAQFSTVQSVTWSPDGKRLAAGSEEAQFKFTHLTLETA